MTGAAPLAALGLLAVSLTGLVLAAPAAEVGDGPQTGCDCGQTAPVAPDINSSLTLDVNATERDNGRIPRRAA